MKHIVPPPQEPSAFFFLEWNPFGFSKHKSLKHAIDVACANAAQELLQQAYSQLQVGDVRLPATVIDRATDYATKHLHAVIRLQPKRSFKAS